MWNDATFIAVVAHSRDVHMRVDEPRQQRALRQVDPFVWIRRLRCRPDPVNASAVDQYGALFNAEIRCRVQHLRCRDEGRHQATSKAKGIVSDPVSTPLPATKSSIRSRTDGTNV